MHNVLIKLINLRFSIKYYIRLFFVITSIESLNTLFESVTRQYQHNYYYIYPNITFKYLL